MPAQLVVATGNAGKLAEFRRLLVGFEVIGCATGVEETGETYEANAVLKATAAAASSGLPALGDDSGLEVAALDGWPGIKSARVAPTAEERIRLLLDRLAGTPAPWPARFVAVLALAAPGAETRTIRAEVEGQIVAPRGGHGFGYDPVFLLPDLGRTMAELEGPAKDAHSHRGLAVRRLLESGWLS